MGDLKTAIGQVWNNRELLKDPFYVQAVEATIEALDKGQLRVAEPVGDQWQTNEWAKRAILLYFTTQKMEIIEARPFEFHDKMKLKTGFQKLGVRVVPQGIARYGSYLAPGVILMPGFVNIGAYVGENTMVDTWVTVGSCAQIGANVHLSGGVGIGGVLEPLQANPVIIEDGCFIGSRAMIVEGVHVGKEVVIAPGVSLTGSSRIFDRTGDEIVEHKAYIPPRSVVVPGVFRKEDKHGELFVNCAYIIGHRKESTDRKTSLNQTLREFSIGG